MSIVGRRCLNMMDGGPAGYDAEPMLGWQSLMMQSQCWVGRLRIQIEIRANFKTNNIYDCWVNEVLSILR
jgi:hypothetical protein